MEHPSLVIKSEVYEKMLGAALKLVSKIQEKQGIETETITQEEADFANAFMDYINAIIEVIDKEEHHK